jgi:hypothetical protein
MPLEEISKRINALPDLAEARELRFLLNGLVDGIRAVTAKLDADAGVTDTNYTATFDAFIIK